MSKQHALLSASGASKWLNCPPSARLEEQFPSSTSSYAEEGTLAHELAELKLTKYITPMGPRTYTTKLNKLKKHELWNKEMEECTDTYMDYIKGIAMSYENPPIIEAETKIDFSAYVPNGFGTADCIIVAHDCMYVIDYKHGKGKSVSADKNPQMMLYAVGAYLKYRILYNIKKVRMTIIQPRLYDEPLEYEMTVNDLIAWADSIVEIANLAINGGGDFKAGNHCDFCRAKSQCRERAEKNLELAQHEFRKPPLLTDEEVGEILKKGENLVSWFKQLQEYAVTESLKGKIIPGWKVVEGRKDRYFTDSELAVKKVIESGIAEEMLYERKQISLTAIEELLGKKAFKEVVGDLIDKKKGKPTLVKESDKREKITNRTSAEEDFKEMM